MKDAAITLLVLLSIALHVSTIARVRHLEKLIHSMPGCVGQQEGEKDEQD